MKLRNGVVRDGQWIEGDGGSLVVSAETEKRMKDPSVTLFLREQGKRLTNGAIFVFSVPTQGFEVSRGNRVAVTQSRHGYTVGEGGLEHPTFKLEGHFGWQLRTTTLPNDVLPIGVKRTVKYDTQTADITFRLPGVGESGAESWVEAALQGRLTLLGLKQTLDGRGAWKALSDLCVYYVTENQKRVSRGDTPLEMVLLYPLEGLRWVVVPKDLPTLRRRWEEQGKWPYTLSLIGVYDDARPRAKTPDDPWALEPQKSYRYRPGETGRSANNGGEQ